jgi:predicted thioesterase/predicted N-acetyltransferase YhbS
MRIRRARPEDIAAVGEVTVTAYADFTGGDADGYVDHLRDAAARDREAELWVATPDDSDEVLGTVTITPSGSPWREIALDGEGEFRMLAVSPAARGAGVGAALVDLVLDRFRSEGARAVVMSTLPQMRAAHRIYERAGFVRDPERDWSPIPGVDLISYRIDLEGQVANQATLSFTVNDEDTAEALGSGDLPVLATPRLLAWCEATAFAALAPLLADGETSVGTRVELEHTRGSRVGARVEVTATSVFRDGRLHRFSVLAREAAGRVVGTGEVTRVVVDAERFLGRL